MKDDPELTAELAAYRDTYVELFGLVPPLPKARFQFTGATDPEGLALQEAYRAHGYHNAVFDEKTTQIIAFAALVAVGAQAAKWHAISARRCGATWEELQMAVTIVSVAAALGPANLGGGVLDETFRAEVDAQK